MDVTQALVQLLQANAEGDWYKIDIATELAKEALGYDPVVQEQNFSVTLEISILATTPEEAVRLWIDMVSQDDFYEWFYGVKDENGNETDIYGMDIKED